jgi:hypothetical protein
MCAADVTTAYPFQPEPDHAELAFAGAFANTNVANTTTPGTTYNAPPARRASFVDAPTDASSAALADAITRCRRACWEQEHEVYGKQIGGEPLAHDSEIQRVPDPDAVDRVRFLKEILGILVEARKMWTGHAPPDAGGWADMWERHSFDVTDVLEVGNTPWDGFSSRAGSRPSATRRTILVARAPDAPEVYLLNPLRHWITSPSALEPFGGFGVVTSVPGEYLRAIPRGADIN